MSAAKIARARRTHPDVRLATWHKLPTLLADPLAVFPSARADGSIVIVTVAIDASGATVIAPALWDASQRSNVVLSIYGKTPRGATIAEWIAHEIMLAKAMGLPAYDKGGPADAEPKPGSAEAIPWSPSPIPVDRSAEPIRQILSIRQKIKNEKGDAP